MRVIINPEIKTSYSVKQNEIVVTDSNKELRTYGMSTCSALVVLGDGKSLLAHVDAKSNIYQIANTIKAHFDLNNSDIEIYLVPGAGAIDTMELDMETVIQSIELVKLSEDKIKEALDTLGLGDRYIELPIYSSFYNDLVVKQGYLYEDRGRLSKNTTPETSDDLRCIFLRNAHPEETRALSGTEIKIGPSKGDPPNNNFIGIYRCE